MLVNMRGIITIVSQLIIFSNCLWTGSCAELLILLSTLMTVYLQYSDLRRSLFGQGNYQLAPAFLHHCIPYSRWAKMSQKARDKAFTDVMVDTGKHREQKIVTSSDERLAVTGTNNSARKKTSAAVPVVNAHSLNISKLCDLVLCVVVVPVLMSILDVICICV